MRTGVIGIEAESDPSQKLSFDLLKRLLQEMQLGACHFANPSAVVSGYQASGKT
jgi:hypothetical protein